MLAKSGFSGPVEVGAFFEERPEVVPLRWRVAAALAAEAARLSSLRERKRVRTLSLPPSSIYPAVVRRSDNRRNERESATTHKAW
jgi:hypothetical protein